MWSKRPPIVVLDRWLDARQKVAGQPELNMDHFVSEDGERPRCEGETMFESQQNGRWSNVAVRS
jgi:hypothetical protein